MELYLYLQAKEQNSIAYASPLNDILNKLSQDLIIYEADQQSESYHMKTGIEFIQKAEKIILHLEDDGQTAIGALAKLFETTRKRKGELLILYSGKNPVFTSVLKMLNGVIAHSNFEEEVRSFLSLD